MDANFSDDIKRGKMLASNKIFSANTINPAYPAKFASNIFTEVCQPLKSCNLERGMKHQNKRKSRYFLE